MSLPSPGGQGFGNVRTSTMTGFGGGIALGRAYFPELTVESFKALVRFQRDPMTMSP